MACCTHGVRRILLLVEEWEGTFFKPSQRTRGNALLGSFYRKCGRRFQHSLESKAGEDSEWRAFSSTLSTERVDRTFLQEWGGPPWPLQGTQTLATSFFRQLGALSWPLPTTIWEVSPPPFLPKSRMGRGPWLSPTMWSGFLKRQWAHSPHKMKWYEDCYGIMLLPKKDRASLSLAPSKRKIGDPLAGMQRVVSTAGIWGVSTVGADSS